MNLVTCIGDTFQEVFLKALKKALTLIGIEVMKKLIGDMERRINGVIAVEGWYTKY